MSNTYSGSFVDHLQDFIGETVTIFTTSGGQSGCGFTGVILLVNPCFVRLITNIGPAPGCAVGNACGRPSGAGRNTFVNNCGFPGNVGSACDIPIDKIACFVHNTV
ncbi:MAG: hypothetical protein GX942_05495 [Papillibacter sp.]|jgi:chemotaxis protein CheY-P-specific phosphatase CheC|nr:hypothetical protein [Papillibacter sp.]